MMGIRSVDPAEQSLLKKGGATVHDMRTIDEFGMASPAARVSEKGGKRGWYDPCQL